MILLETSQPNVFDALNYSEDTKSCIVFFFNNPIFVLMLA